MARQTNSQKAILGLTDRGAITNSTIHWKAKNDPQFAEWMTGKLDMGALYFLGVSTTNPIFISSDPTSGQVTIDGEVIDNKSLEMGYFVIYNEKEYIYDGSEWVLVGDELEIEYINSEIVRVNDRINTTNDNITTIDNKVNTLTDTVINNDNKTSEEFIRVNDRLDDTDGKIVAINNQITGIDGNCDQFNTKFQQLDSTVAGIQGSVADINELLTTAAYKFDATPLYTAMRTQTAIDENYYNDLLDAIKTKKVLYISDQENDGTIVNLIVVYINKKNNEMVFSVFNGATSFLFTLNTTNFIVSLNTESIGAEFSIFNNTNGLNLFVLNTKSTIEEIKVCFTDARDEERIPDTGDIINVLENSYIVRSGIVISRNEDRSGIHMHILVNDFVTEHIADYYIQFSYNPQVGIDSLKLTNTTNNILDFSLISSAKMTELISKVERLEKLEKEINEFNISSINNNNYDLQGAISALNTYLGDRPVKYVGLKITFINLSNGPETHIYKGGSFVDTRNWTKLY